MQTDYYNMHFFIKNAYYNRQFSYLCIVKVLNNNRYGNVENDL